MSLVAAYGFSDDSEDSETENEKEGDSTPVSPIKTDESRVTSEGRLEVVQNHDAEPYSGENQQHQPSQNESFDTLLKGLPAPHTTSTEVITENDILEEEVRAKPSQMSDVPKPPPKRNRQPVKITLPALEQDSDEDEPTKKKSRTANTGGKSGLTSLLPAPVHAAKKETNRILLPYTLSRKPKPTPQPKPSFDDKPPSPSYMQKKYSMFHGLTGYDSDSDENEDETEKTSEPVNFFSLDSKQKSDKENETLKDPSSVKAELTGLSTSIPTVSLPPPPSEHLPTNEKQSKLDISNDNITGPIQGPSLLGPQLNPDAPLTFKGGQKSRVSVPSASASVSNVYGPVIDQSNADLQGEIHDDQNMYYNMPYEQASSYIEATDVKALEQDEEFLKLQGKPKRGKEEINFLEVNTADFISTAEVTKSLSEEQQEHRSHKKKDMPSSQQKRKHQIGYLAFQAKERELELKNQWATNRMTKKQTQAKYGF